MEKSSRWKLFQNRGLKVVPNIRWAEKTDLEFVCDGLPRQSVIAISTQSLLGDFDSREIFASGIEEVLCKLEPETLYIYGNLPEDTESAIIDSAKLVQFPTDIQRAHSKKVK